MMEHTLGKAGNFCFEVPTNNQQEHYKQNWVNQCRISVPIEHPWWRDLPAHIHGYKILLQLQCD